MNRLRAHRKNLGLTLDQLNKMLGIDKANLSRIERGTQRPSLPTARKLAKLYRLTLDEVYYDS